MWKVSVCTQYPENPRGNSSTGSTSHLTYELRETLEKHPVNAQGTRACAPKQENWTKPSLLVMLNKSNPSSSTCCLSSNHTPQQATILKGHSFPSLILTSLWFVHRHEIMNKSSSWMGKVRYRIKTQTECGLLLYAQWAQNSSWASMCLDHQMVGQHLLMTSNSLFTVLHWSLQSGIRNILIALCWSRVHLRCCRGQPSVLKN